MMMGQGYYGYGGASSPSSSNLSALAPPFTVDRSVPKSGSNPLVDLTEPTYAVTFNSSLHNWVGAHPPSSRLDYFSISNSEFDSVPSSNAYGYSSSTAHVPPLNPCVSVSASTNLLEVKPYYPSYVSPAIGSDGSLGVSHHSGYDLLSTTHVATPNGSSNDDYIQSLSGMEHLAQWSGLWEGLVDWQQSEQVQLERSFSSNENFIDQGLYASDSMSKYEEASHSIDTIGGDNHAETVVIEKLDYKPFLGENPKFLPTEYSKTSSSTSTLLVPENCSQAPAIKAVNSWNHQMPFGASYEKCFRKHDASPSDFATIVNSSSPAVVIRPPDTSSPRNMNPGNDEDDKDFASKDSSVVKEPHPFMSSKGYVYFDASQVSFHLQQNDQVAAEFSSAKNEEQSSSGDASADALNNFAKGKPGIQAPHRSLDGFNLVVDKNEAINSVKNHSENLDNYTPAVDSPCWKGAPVSQFSQFEVSEAVTPQNMKKLEACSGSNLQSHQIFTFSANDAVKSFPEKTSKNSVHHDAWSLGNHSTSSLRRPLVANVFPREEIVDAAKSGPQYTNSSCFEGVQISDDAVSNKSTDNSDHKPHKNEQQSCEGAKWTSGKNCAPGFGANIKSTDNSDHRPHQNEEHSCEDAKWTSGKNCAPGFGIDIEMEMNDNPDDCSSHVPFDAIEHVLHSPPFADDVPTKLSKSHGEESTRTMNVRTLLDTMQNLSELLLFHFSHDACELNEDDYGVLKGVISNLDLCMLKNVETMTSLQESVIPQKASSQLHGKSAKLQKDMNASLIDPPNSEAQFKRQHVQDNELNTVPDKNDEKLPNFGSLRAAADISIDDNMTQAIRKALKESFHVEEETDPQVILYKNLWLEAEALLCSAGCMARYQRMKSEMEKCDSQKVTGLQEYTAFMEKLSRSKVSTEPGMNKMLASDTKGSPQTGTSIPESSIKSMTKHEDEVAARYHILKCQAESSNTLNTSGVDKTIDFTLLPSSKISLNLNNIDKLACEEKDSQKPDLSIQDSPKLSTSQVDDFEDSVMARFQILKSRVENVNSVDKEEHQRATNDLGYAGLRRHWPMCEHESEDRILNVNMESVSENHAGYSTEDKLTVKEFRLFVKDDPMNNRPGDQFHDGSSDWEHVLFEELAVQNC
ncbi:uncharacterized protein LOC105640811 isoform X2 [Jatropha curcas]|nr:uncharacterized protein LOC105640811 isoform X2 [Jatropha curcas]